MTILQFLDKYKTQIAGYLTSAVAMIELSPARNVLFKSDESFAVFVLAVGLVVSFIGIFNAGVTAATSE